MGLIFYTFVTALMYHLKKHIAFVFLLTLFIPTIVSTCHDFFEDHEHVICTSKTTHHLHELANDCGDLHLQLELYNGYLVHDYDLRPIVSFVKKSILQPKQVYGLFFSHKASRGPPYL